MRVFLLSGFLTASLVCTTAVLSAQTYAVEDLPGYSRQLISEDFAAFLQENPQTVAQLRQHAELSRLIFNRRNLQQQLVKKEITIAELLAAQQKKTAAKPNMQKLLSPENRQAAAADIAATLAAVGAGDQQGVQQLTTILTTLQKEDTQIYEFLLANADLQERIRTQQIGIDDVRELYRKQSTLNSRVSPNKPADAAPQPVTYPLTAEQAQPEQYKYVDVNARITTDKNILDANGWPKYLNVPADCPPPQEGMHYLHAYHAYSPNVMNDAPPGYFKNRGVLPNASATRPELMAVEPPFGQGHNNRDVFLEDNQISAVPFITPPNAPDYVDKNYVYIHYLGVGANPSWAALSISRCPGYVKTIRADGQFPQPTNGGTMGGVMTACHMPHFDTESALHYRISSTNEELIDVALPSPITDFEKTCVLKPSTRYFLNTRPDKASLDALRAQGPGQMYSDKMFLSRQYGGAYNGLKFWKLPYTNECIRGQAGQLAFPINYRSNWTGGFDQNGVCQPMLPRNAHVPSGYCERMYAEFVPRDTQFVTTCNDPTGELPTARFVDKCDGTNILRNEGYGAGQVVYGGHVCRVETVYPAGYNPASDTNVTNTTQPYCDDGPQARYVPGANKTTACTFTDNGEVRSTTWACQSHAGPQNPPIWVTTAQAGGGALVSPTETRPYSCETTYAGTLYSRP